MGIERAWHAGRLRLRSLFRHGMVEQELDEELRDHVERQTELLVARGVSPVPARAEALRRIGGTAFVKDQMRDARRVSVAENLIRDLRYGVRTLRKSPGFTAAAVLTLALGIGANTAMFTVVNSVLLRPLAYAEPSRLTYIHHEGSTTVAPANVLDWEARSRSFERMASAAWWSPVLTGGDRPEELDAIRATAGLLPMLGVAPELGRVFTDEEAHSGRDRVVVLTHDFWVDRFASARTALGQSLTLNGENYTIIGVMPPHFEFVPFWATSAVLAAPLVLDTQKNDRNASYLRAFGRLKPGASISSAQSELASISAALEAQFPGTNPKVTATPLQDEVVGDVRPALTILFAVVGVVLLIACVNVAHLQLMRAVARQREFAVRAALGGSRSRIVQQSLVESALVAVAGAGLGLLLAAGGVRWLVRLAPSFIPRPELIGLDARVFLFLVVVSLLAGLGFGVMPALLSARVDLQGVLKEGGRGHSGGPRGGARRGVLVISQFAMALTLLVGAGLVIRSFAARLGVDPGFDRHNLVTMRVSLSGTASGTPGRRARFFSQLADGVRGTLGVMSAGMVNHIPLHGDNWVFPYSVEGRPLTKPGKEARAWFRVVRPGFFLTMGTPLLAGRDLSTADEESRAHVVIINEVLAQKQWPGESPLGKRISVDDPATHPDWFTVIGVTASTRQGSWEAEAAAEMFFPYMDAPGEGQALVSFLDPESMTLVVRTLADPIAATRAVEGLVHALEVDAPVTDVITMDQAISEQLAQPRIYLVLLGGFAAVALILAAVGVYGTISYSVARRQHEIGVRLALGATRRDAFWLIARQGMRLAAVGGAIGVVAALAASRLMRTLLYGVSPLDLLTFAGAAVLLALVALGACWIPARRASRVDPVRALRAD